MSNFITAFQQGQTGVNKGIPYGEGLESITSHTNGIHKKRIIAFAGAEKSGKSTLVDYAMVISVYLYALKYKLNVSWVYYTYEIDRVSKEFDFATFFLHYDYGIEDIDLPEGVLKDGKNRIPLSPSYLKGEIMDDNENVIKVSQDIFEKLQVVYNTRIVPLFGYWSPEGILETPGLITIREQADNPTGIYKDLLEQANQRGKVYRDGNKRPIKYVPNDPNELRIVIIDHIRKLVPERGYKMKETIDKMSEYLVALRNLLSYTFVPIIHTNRGLASMDKISTFKGNLYPTSDDVKDSGNIGEDCNYLFTIMNPNDDKYNITKHFNVDIRDSRNNILHPNFKTIHLVSSRHCEFPRHFSVNMKGNIKKFEKF